MENPYQQPSARLELRKERFNDRLDDVAFGQKRIIYAIALQVIAMVLINFVGLLSIPAVLISIGLSFSGVYRIARGLEYPFWLRLVLMVLLLVPLLSLLTLVFANNRATERMRRAGYPVGLLGAKY